MRTIIVSGTPGTGKTTTAKSLSRSLGYRYIDVKKMITRQKLSEGYDKKRNSKIVDEKKLSKKLIGIINTSKTDLIIDSHLSHFIPRKYIDLCIITKTGLKELEKRLKKKRYSRQKIKENLEAEIFDICFEEAKSRKHKIFVIDTTKRLNMIGLAAKLKKYGIERTGKRAEQKDNRN